MFLLTGAAVAQSVNLLRVTGWPADLMVPGSSPASGGDLFNCKSGSTSHSLSLSPTHCPDITEILLKRMQNLKSSITPSFECFLCFDLEL